jgi:hypothetical protein
METMERAEAIRGKTLRLIWLEGPTRGAAHDHVFHADGTVEWHDAKSADKAEAGGAAASGAQERPPYAAMEAAEGIYAVSYLAPSGYTLTVVLNFRDRTMVGIASSAKDWHPVRGRFETVNRTEG